jgi:hypothetical protein
MLEFIQLSQVDLGAVAATKTFDDLDDVRDPILGLAISLTGLNKGTNTDALTLAGIDDISIKMGGSAVATWKFSDLFYYNAIKRRTLTDIEGSSTDNDYKRVTLFLPFGMSRPWDYIYDYEHGLVRGSKSISMDVTVSADPGTNGLDSRKCDVMAVIDPEMGKPSSYLAHIKRSYTAVADEEKDIDLGEGPEELVEFFGFQTTNLDDGVTALATTIKEVRILRNKKEDIIRTIKSEMFNGLYGTNNVKDEFVYLNLAPPLKFDKPTALAILGGDAAAVRAYPGIFYPNE